MKPHQLLIALFFVFAAAPWRMHAQHSYAMPGDSWKKTVGRTIDWFYEPAKRKVPLRDMNNTAGIFEMLAIEIKAGRVPAYPIKGSIMSHPMSQKKIAAIFGTKRDTIQVIDPITGDDIVQVRAVPFDYRSVVRYRIVETWTYNPTEQKTNISVEGIIPIQAVYGDDGMFRGWKELCYLSYADIAHIIARYEQYHPDNKLSARIWENYFQSDAKPDAEK